MRSDEFSLKKYLIKCCCYYCPRKNAEDALQGLNGSTIGKQTVRLSWGRNPANKQVQKLAQSDSYSNKDYNSCSMHDEGKNLDTSPVHSLGATTGTSGTTGCTTRRPRSTTATATLRRRSLTPACTQLRPTVPTRCTATSNR